MKEREMYEREVFAKRKKLQSPIPLIMRLFIFLSDADWRKEEKGSRAFEGRQWNEREREGQDGGKSEETDRRQTKLGVCIHL
mmetsp:Transcript_16162/g.32734  ORF Transcript_16162/g.32734 Transcript_16162/m.32734 type:complete len:82 (-) Transcript_16162:318-563(-)